MSEKLPTIIVTGASGFVGRHFLERAKSDFSIIGLCRRSQKEAGIPEHPNIRWVQADLADWPVLKSVIQRVKEQGGADYVLHLAGYYDFSYDDHPEYIRTNVNGTRHMLEAAKWLSIRRFIFSSSLAACEFPPPGKSVTEKTLPDARFPYAVSKLRGEELVKEYSRWFPCSTVRLAAVFSDWCEYPPLSVFLSTWFSGRWNARILGGRGESAVSYIHVRDLNRLFLTLIEKTHDLPPHDTYNASPNGSTSHLRLFETATRYYYGRTVPPIFMPKSLAYPGILFRRIWGQCTGKPVFEQTWMVKYIDRKLNVDSAYTRRALGWEPTPRYHVLRRSLFMIEKMKSNPGEWDLRNETALKRVVQRTNLKMYEALVSIKDDILRQVIEYVRAPERINEFPNYRSMSRSELEWYIGIVYRLLMASVRTGDRALMLEYAVDIARRRFEEGFAPAEIRGVLQTLNRFALPALEERPELKGLEQEIYDAITLTMQLATDEIEDCYSDHMERKRRVGRVPPRPSVARTGEELERIIAHMEAFYRPAEPGVGDEPDAAPASE
jgi:nucleoside-diphosphate-sugar epimerase